MLVERVRMFVSVAKLQSEVNSVKVSDNLANVNPGLLAGCSSLNELTLPINSDHTT